MVRKHACTGIAASLAAAALSLGAGSPAAASPLIFTSSQNLFWELRINGAQVERAAFDTGFFRDDGIHNPANQNYSVGTSGDHENNNYGRFDLSTVSPTLIVTSVELRADAGFNTLEADETVTWSLFDVAADPSLLDQQYTSADPLGDILFADLGSGTLLGAVTVGQFPRGAAEVSVTFNQAGIAAVQSALGRQFAVGGTLHPVTPLAAVPEPAGWAMMIAGFGAIGRAMRRRPSSRPLHQV